VSNIFLVYNQNGNIQTATTNYPNVVPPAQLLVADETTPNAQAALGQPQNYMVQNGQIVPAATLIIARTQQAPAAGSNFYSWTISISASDGGSHTVNLNIAGHTQTVTTPATVQVAIHQAVNNYHYPVIASGQGIVTQESFIGGNNLDVPSSQFYTDASGLLHIAPTQKATLLAYYTSLVQGASALADIATGIGMLLDAVFGKIIPALTSGTSPLLTLSANAANAVNDIKSNILPNIPTTLENAAPKPATGSPQTYDLHYASFERHWSALQTAFDAYAADLQTIPNLV
jgi:hypothetical protein